MKQRPPIVVVLGHVDHGKTTLLDTLKKTHVAASEAGGITQSIGASQLHFKDKKLTFIDTPGHAAFGAMRAGGATIADLAILVVAADDGVKPQTIEALETIRQANIPYIVAINKVDLPAADVKKVKTQLTEVGSAVEGFGGTVPVVEISAKEGTHLPELLEMIFLVHELSDVSGSENQPLEAPVIESRRDPKAGPLVSVVVRSGNISLGDDVVAHGIHGKVKALFADDGERVSRRLPGDPAQVLGFDDIVPVGSVVGHLSKENEEVEVIPMTSPPTVNNAPKEERPQSFVLKANSAGTLAALAHIMPQGTEIVLRGVGDITESDVLHAESTGATIVGFGVKASKSAMALAETHGIPIVTNPIIYKLLESLEKPQAIQVPAVELGRATIVKIFDISDKQVAGCTVISGRLAVGDAVRVDSGATTESDQTAPPLLIKQIKKGKIDTTVAKAGEECGVLLAPADGQRLNFAVGNAIIAFEKKKGKHD